VAAFAQLPSHVRSHEAAGAADVDLQGSACLNRPSAIIGQTIR
jgi:hypothetical protein